MPVLIQYLIKLSVALSITWLFYALVLRRLTFYNWNRWYLLVYPVFAFIIPLFDIAGILEEHRLSENMVVQVIPALGMGNVQYVAPAEVAGKLTWDPWQVLLIVLLIVMVLMSIRLLMRYFSYLLMRRSAQVIANAPVKVFQVNMNIVPFSFGNSIYINQAMHSEEELKKIIEHEFVHIRQRHSFDIILAEIICILNWYNPFAWLIRRSIRQNLEFIADNDVLRTGIDPKQYQYLLLKVTGNTAYGMGNNFNLSSLAKRIIMMNKTKSAGIHLLKFLFILPLVAVMILAFRNNINHARRQSPGPDKIVVSAAPVIETVKAVAGVPAKSLRKGQPVVKGTEFTADTFIIDASLRGPGNPYLTLSPVFRQHDTTGNDPLILVNGKDTGISLRDIDANQIESLSVYKGSSAVDLYGAKGRNGVILITLKNQGITLSWQKLSFMTRQAPDGRKIEVKKEFADSLSRLREDVGILYIGVNNIVEVKVKDTDPEKINLLVDNATVSRDGEKFDITVKTSGNTVLRILVTGNDGTQKEVYHREVYFKYLPVPTEKDIISR